MNDPVLMMGMQAGLTVAWVKEKDFELMAGNAMKDICNFTYPRTAKLVEVIQIYKDAM